MQTTQDNSISDCTLPSNLVLNDNSLRCLRSKHPNNITIAYLNINSVRSKLDQSNTYLGNAISILMIAETKLDETFPDSQFKIPGMKKPYRFDVTANSGGLLVYIDANVSSKRLVSNLLPNDLQVILFVINSNNRKLLIIRI